MAKTKAIPLSCISFCVAKIVPIRKLQDSTTRIVCVVKVLHTKNFGQAP